MAKYSWNLIAILLSILFLLTDASPESDWFISDVQFSHDLIIVPKISNISGLRVEGGKNEGFIGLNENGSSIVQPDVKVKITVFGSFLDEVNNIGFVVDENCSTADQVLKKSFEFQSENVIVLNFKLKPTNDFYKICIKQNPFESGKDLIQPPYVTVNESRTFITTKIPRHDADIPVAVKVILIAVIFALSGYISCIYMSLTTLTPEKMEHIFKKGTRKERTNTEILFVNNGDNMFSYSLLFAKVFLNSAISILLYDLLFEYHSSGTIVTMLSSVAILIFLEIIPKLISGKYGITIAANSMLLIRQICIMNYPITCICLMLDRLFGDDVTNDRKEVMESIKAEYQNENEEELENCVEDLEDSNKTDNKNIPKVYKFMSNNQFSDLILVTSDNIKIPCHRCILAKYSLIFAKIIEETSEVPVEINVGNFNAKTVQAVLDFLYGKTDLIDGIEMDVFEFGVNYDIKVLIDACCSFFEEAVDPTNVCEYIQIAYNHNFEGLKQMCLFVLADSKNEMEASELKKLPKHILFDIFLNHSLTTFTFP